MPWTTIETVSPHQAFTRWGEHRDRFSETGLWPVFLTTNFVEDFESPSGVVGEGLEDILAKAAEIDTDEFLAQRIADMKEDYELWQEKTWDGVREFDVDAVIPSVHPTTEIAVERILGVRREGVPLSLVPCRVPWHVPAILNFGGWNECPSSAEHVAVLRDWHTRYGAEPLVIGYDTLVLRVRPVSAPAEAKRVAIQHLAYDPDIDMVDEETVGDVLGASVWSFWWD